MSSRTPNPYGGETLTLVPSLNSRADWVHTLADWVRARG